MVTPKGLVCVADGPLMITVGASKTACTEYRPAAALPRST